jgi:hypothetical protein
MAGTGMTDITIASYGTYTTPQPLSNGTNIEFLNDISNNGVVIFSRGAIGVSVTGTPGSYTSSAYFGGSITNFLPGAYPGILGDQATIQVFESLFNAMDVATTATADNSDFDGHMTLAAQSGDQILIINGTVQVSVDTPFTLTANEAQIIDDIAIGLFGTAANNATLDLAFALRTNPNSNHPFIDGVFTSTTPINETATNPCFAAGTRILTTRGDVPVEDLAIGDLLITPDGEEQPIIWIGIRRVENIQTYRRPEAVRPIIIEAGALADHMPARNLAVSPDHAIYFDGVLVPAKALVNWNSIRQDHRVNNITYYHLELPRHGIIFAESTPAESYLDTGHRGAFDNDDSILVDHPAIMQHRRDTQACAPLCYSGPKLDAIRARIASRQVGIRLVSR